MIPRRLLCALACALGPLAVAACGGATLAIDDGGGSSDGPEPDATRPPADGAGGDGTGSSDAPSEGPGDGSDATMADGDATLGDATPGDADAGPGTDADASADSGDATQIADADAGPPPDAPVGDGGDCLNPGNSYVGCEYFAVPLSNDLIDQTTFQFSVALSNTSALDAAAITITGPNGFNQTATLPPAAIENFVLPWVPGISCASGGPCNSGNTKAPPTVRVDGGAYHIVSTEPLTAYQFNAYDYEIGGNYSYTNDASLLIPVNAMTGNYYVVAGATWAFSNNAQFPGIVAIVGTQDNTTVTFTPPAGQLLQAGAGLTTTGGTVTLGRGDVLQIASALDAPAQYTYGSDLSGGTVTASAPVEVFGGHTCSFVPADHFACDHLEQIDLPVETLRNDYLVTLPFNTNAAPRQYVKIVGTLNGTTLTTDPVQGNVPPTLGAGGVVWFEATQNFHLTSSAPVLVGQFMESDTEFCMNNNGADCGDPSLSVAVATGQFRAGYQFIAPPSYAENWVNVIAPNGATVTVDGVAVPPAAYSTIGASGFGVAHVSLCTGQSCAGVHVASAQSPFGIQVYGYGSYTSYMYPGGLDLWQ